MSIELTNEQKSFLMENNLTIMKLSKIPIDGPDPLAGFNYVVKDGFKLAGAGVTVEEAVTDAIGYIKYNEQRKG